MFKNYLKIAWRNLQRHKSYSAINISGLAIGMSASILILLWVQHELSFDRFHKNADTIYRLICNAGDFKAAVSPAGMAEGLQAELPALKAGVRLSKPTDCLIEVNDKKFEEQVFFADSNFLQFFSFPLLTGDPATALDHPDGVLLTEDKAMKYFGHNDVLGKIIRVNNNENFRVTGVLANTPSNSHLQLGVVFPMATLAKTDNDLKNKVWGAFNFYTYFLIDQSMSKVVLQNLEKQIKSSHKSHGARADIDFHLQPLTAIHLHSDLQIDVPGHGNIQYVNIFIIVAFIILLVACINFMNLATARSARRAKEVGLRKVVGASRYQILLQFLGESIIISFVSLLCALVIVAMVLPAFNHLSGKTLSIWLLDKNLWVTLGCIVLFTGLASGSYPALFLSGFQPAKVLKGKFQIGVKNLLFRNALVLVQFVVAIVLLVGTAAVYKQLNFIKDKSLGFDKSNLLYMPMKGQLWNKQQALKAELSAKLLTANYSIISDLPTELISGTTDVDWSGRDPQSQVVIPSIDVDEHFVDVFKVKTITGRYFSSTFKSDSNDYLINEQAMKLMGFNLDNTVGQRLRFGGNTGTILGVVQDFNFKPLQYAIEPLVLRFNKEGGLVVVRTESDKTDATLKSLEKINQSLNPAFPFTYHFLDNELDKLYESEQKMGSIFNVFALLAIFISCLGLYGLSAFLAEQRKKEIGVRKVLGASVFKIVFLLSSNITRLIIISVIIAVPLSWLAISKWLKDFAYHIDISWTIFAIASLSALAIAWITVGYDTIKAALANPMKSLRSE